MGALEIILLIIIFIWLIDISYSRLKILKYIETIARDLNELENRIKQLDNKWENKFSDTDFDTDN